MENQEFQRLMEKHNNLHINAKRHRDLNAQLLEALVALEKEFRETYPIYYYNEPWGHETNKPLKQAQAVIEAARRNI